MVPMTCTNVNIAVVCRHAHHEKYRCDMGVFFSKLARCRLKVGPVIRLLVQAAPPSLYLHVTVIKIPIFSLNIKNL